MNIMIVVDVLAHPCHASLCVLHFVLMSLSECLPFGHQGRVLVLVHDEEKIPSPPAPAAGPGSGNNHAKYTYY